MPCEGKLVAGSPLRARTRRRRWWSLATGIRQRYCHRRIRALVAVGAVRVADPRIALSYLTRSRGRFITGAAKPAQSLRRRLPSRYNNNNNIILPRSCAL